MEERRGAFCWGAGSVELRRGLGHVLALPGRQLAVFPRGVLLRTLDEAGLRATTTGDRALRRVEGRRGWKVGGETNTAVMSQRSAFTREKLSVAPILTPERDSDRTSITIVPRLLYLLPGGDEPLDLALFGAAFDEAGLLAAGSLHAHAGTVGQAVRPSNQAGAHARHRPPPQALPTLPGTLQGT